MSDDDYVYDSPYEDVYDILYDADPAPELADDLAERAVHSPIWQHTHTGELKDYFSDWDDHSDDYWDDDPKLLNGNKANGKPSKAAHVEAPKPAKRGRKRKLSEAREMSTAVQESLETLQATLRGTVWKAKSPELTDNYKKGSEKPTALRLSASIMRSAYNKTQGFGRIGLKRDESWANDLSLADMGLTSQPIAIGQPDGAMDEEVAVDDDELDEPLLDSDPRTIDLVEDKDIKTTGKLEASDDKPAMDQDKNDENSMHDDAYAGTDDSSREHVSRKKRKVAGASSRRTDGALLNPEDSATSIVSKAAPRSRKKINVLFEDTGMDTSSQDTVAQDDPQKDELNGRSNRKRNLSPNSSAIASTASSRAKRAAKNTTHARSITQNSQPGRTTRSRET